MFCCTVGVSYYVQNPKVSRMDAWSCVSKSMALIIPCSRHQLCNLCSLCDMRPMQLCMICSICVMYASYPICAFLCNLCDLSDLPDLCDVCNVAIYSGTLRAVMCKSVKLRIQLHFFCANPCNVVFGQVRAPPCNGVLRPARAATCKTGPTP